MTKVTHKEFLTAVESAVKLMLSGKVPERQEFEFVDPDGVDRRLRMEIEVLNGGDVVLTIIREGEFSPVVELVGEHYWDDTSYIELDNMGFHTPNTDTRLFQLKLLVELEKVYA